MKKIRICVDIMPPYARAACPELGFIIPFARDFQEIRRIILKPIKESVNQELNAYAEHPDQIGSMERFQRLSQIKDFFDNLKGKTRKIEEIVEYLPIGISLN
jgi:hypothetical protein